MFHEGWAAAVDGSDSLAPLPFDDVFKGKKLWRAADGELFVENTRTKIVASLWDQWARYERADVEIMVGVLKLPCKHTCYITGWLRHGTRVFWDAVDIFKVLQLTTHNGVVGRRVYSNKDMFTKLSVQLCGSSDHAAKSFRQSGRSRRPREGEARFVDDWARLPQMSLSTALFVLCLSRWVSLPTKRGGFYHSADKAAGITFLSCLTRAAAAGNGYQIPVVLDPHWMPPWPGKEEKLPNVNLTVRSDGAVDLREFERVLHSVGIHAKMRIFWKQLLTITGGEARTVDVGDLLRSFLSQDYCSGFFRQVVWKLASRLDYLIMSSLKTGSGSLLRATTCDLLDILWNRRRLDYELVKQVAAQTTYAAGRVNYSFATDEAHVGGPSLFNTVVVYKDNTALLMCPQVRPIQRQIRALYISSKTLEPRAPVVYAIYIIKCIDQTGRPPVIYGFP